MRFGCRLFIILGSMIAVLMLIGETSAQFSAAPKSSRTSASAARPAATATERAAERGVQRAATSGGGNPKTKSQHPVQRASISISDSGLVDAGPLPAPPAQTTDDVSRKSWSCVQCHRGASDMHASESVKLGCIDCHGGDAQCLEKNGAHVMPDFPAAWSSAGNPVRSYTLLNHESPEFIRFVNPGDLRVAHISCGSCHAREVLEVRKSMMTHGCMLWGAALYNNGAVPNKAPQFGESYSMHGVPQRVQTVWRGEDRRNMQRDLAERGVLPFLDPLPRFEVSQPGNILRIFEMGGRFRPETGIPEKSEEPGRPRTRLSNRGLGTENRTDPVFIGLQKTRLLDPTLNFLGTNDHPGDYRSSGCSACHVVYANDRSPVHSGPYAKYGHLGRAASQTDSFVTNVDPTIATDEPGHPIAHRFTTSIPTSQCIVCHIHPGTTVLNTYLGFMWWDNETDGDLMYPEKQRYPTAEEIARATMSNPEEASIRGLWSDPDFLANVTDLNQQARHTQFADFHGHGWVFRAVFKKNREGELLDYQGRILDEPGTTALVRAMDPPSHDERLEGKKREETPVHLMDIHLEKGMHCIDCHYQQDNHGNTKLYGEVRAAIEIGCIDCHGTASESIPKRIARGERMLTSGPAAPDATEVNANQGASEKKSSDQEERGTDLMLLRTPFRQPRFEIRGGKLIQHSMVEPGLQWEVVQTADSIDPKHPRYNRKSHQAKTVRWNGKGEMAWGGTPSGEEHIDGQPCAHQNSNMSCISCHSSWNPSCFGCHLPQKANRKAPGLHNEGEVSRNLTAYNFQTLRDDVYMLARDGMVTGNRINPARSSCAIHVTSYNNNRESIYTQQQTISGGGMSGIAFSTNVPHTVRGKSDPEAVARGGYTETKSCTDCHLSSANDNNAVLAQLLMQGTNFVNFVGRYCWVAGGEHGLHAVVVTEQDEPQAVIGSSLHRLAFPDNYRDHQRTGQRLLHAHEHPGMDISEKLLHPLRKHEVLMVQARGEYLYAACGEDGFRAFDIAFIDHKGFSERITTAPVSPAGQRFHVPTKYATAVAAPTTIAPDPTRVQPPENMEQPVHPLYAFLYVTDREEGLILIGAGTLLDGNPLNNFLKRELTYNPDGILNGATNITIVGTYAYICCDAGLVVVDLQDPMHPTIRSVIDNATLPRPRSVQVQFRYAFVCDAEGLKVLDVTDLANPRLASSLELPDARNVYVARTYAYVAGGENGLYIVDVTDPTHPKLDQIYDANGCINDLCDLKLGITYTSEFAYLADGKNGMRVVQLTSPETPGSSGFSPRPSPQLIATFEMPHGGHALHISKGVDRDRAVDESGNQIAVFGRIGARPLNLAEQQRMYLRRGRQHGDREGEAWFVDDDLPDSRRTR